MVARGWPTKSLGVWIFFGSGSGANKFQDVPGFAEAAPPELEALVVERQPVISDTAAKHINIKVRQLRNQTTEALTA